MHAAGAGIQAALDYKMSWSGGMLVAVPPHNTSRTCPRCAQRIKTQSNHPGVLRVHELQIREQC
jgi:transposase